MELEYKEISVTKILSHCYYRIFLERFLIISRYLR